MRYSKITALEFIKTMEDYENTILKVTRNLYDTAIDFSSWKDDKHEEFCNVLSSVIQGIQNASNVIDDYSKYYEQLIKEFD